MNGARMADVFQDFFGDRRRDGDRGDCRSTLMCFENRHLCGLTLVSSHHVRTINKKAQTHEVSGGWLTEGCARYEIKLLAPVFDSACPRSGLQVPGANDLEASIVEVVLQEISQRSE
ncbi:hypothetical protein MRX96_019147 [Rhipicephalus microplus]